MQPNLNKKILLLLGTLLSIFFPSGLSSERAWAQSAEFSEERTDAGSRIRVSLIFYRFSIDDKHLIGSGTEFGFERSLSSRWNVSGALGQAYTLDTDNFGTIFTLMDISIWYSIFGTFTQEQRIFKNAGNVIAAFENRKSGGLRFGLGTQQYYFNTSVGTIPFSGLAVKFLYELGLDFSFDLAVGAEASRLENTNNAVTSFRGLGAIIWPLKP